MGGCRRRESCFCRDCDQQGWDDIVFLVGSLFIALARASNSNPYPNSNPYSNPKLNPVQFGPGSAPSGIFFLPLSLVVKPTTLFPTSIFRTHFVFPELLFGSFGCHYEVLRMM